MTEQKKSKDNQFFDCLNTDEHHYMASLYGNRKTVVAAFLKDKCGNGSTQLSTYLDVYELIELKLCYPLPLKRLKANKPKLKQ
ncbi:MAG: hypothetical protein ACJAUD_000250 [Crocinitomicaceae bacterium]|jgi:hypothetical protein